MAEKGKVTKVILADAQRQPIAAASLQEPEDPFSYGANGLQEPPYNPERLLALSELHTTHQAALEQKTADIIGSGWHWKEIEDGADPEQKKKLDDWLRSLADPTKDETTSEILASAWTDLETIGQGMIEVARDAEGKVKRIYSASSHMVRFHKDGKALAQGVSPKRVWFKRWVPGDTQALSRKDGKALAATSTADRANELLVLRRPTKRSSHYGVPGYVSAIGWIALSLSARDDNIQFFNNRREPRWAIILQNIEDEDEKLEAQLRDAFTTSLKEPHRNIFIPIEGPGKIDFKQLSQDAKDISFDKLQERASGEILVAHRLPPDRLGAVRVGPLGGNTTVAASRVYKEAVVAPAQDFLQSRINRFIGAEGPIPAVDVKWRWQPTELDLTEEAEDVNVVTEAWTANLMRLNEARDKLHLPRVDEGDGGNKFFFELTGDNPAAAAGAAAQAGARVGGQLAASIMRSRTTSPVRAERELSQRIVEILTQHDAEREARRDDVGS